MNISDVPTERVCDTCGIVALPVAIQVGSDGETAAIGDLLTPLTRPVADRAWCSWACWPFNPSMPVACEPTGDHHE